MLPELKKLFGKKVLIADNKSTHLNVTIFQKCRKENISFVCLPPNSTHLTQPLDVAFFRPMKIAWRKVLLEWKGTPEGLCFGVLLKQYFPSLLNQVLDFLEPNILKNLRSGFQECGIYPCDVQPLIDRISNKKIEASAISSSFLDALKLIRTSIVIKPKLAKKKLVNIPAVKSLSRLELLDLELDSNKSIPNQNNVEPQPGPSQPSKSTRKKREKFKNYLMVPVKQNLLSFLITIYFMTW